MDQNSENSGISSITHVSSTLRKKFQQFTQHDSKLFLGFTAKHSVHSIWSI